MKGKIFWLTGLSGSGKSTLCDAIVPILTKDKYTLKIIDGDVVRSMYTKPIGFERSDVLENNLRIAKLAEEAASTVDIVLVPVIAPYSDVREKITEYLRGKVFWVYCGASIDCVVKREVKGLYKKSLAGEIVNMIGMSQQYPYEVPANPDMVIATGDEHPSSSAEKIIKFIKEKIKNHE